MLSERNRELVERELGPVWADLFAGDNANHMNRLLDAARAEGGAASDLAAGTHQPVAQQTRAEPNHAGGDGAGLDLDGLVERLRQRARSPSDYLRLDAPLINEAADALEHQARLLEERTRERDEAREVAFRGGVCLKHADARAEAAERLWAWLDEHRNLELSYEYGEPEDDEGRWEVFRVSGGRSDREWEVIATGATPLDAVQAARQTLSKVKDSALGLGSMREDLRSRGLDNAQRQTAGSQTESPASAADAVSPDWWLLQRLYNVANAARTYFDGYCQDEAADDGPDFTGCSYEQHRDAKALGEALKEYSSAETLAAVQAAAKPEAAQ